MACLVALISGLTSACVILATVEGGEVEGGQDQAYGDRLGVSFHHLKGWWLGLRR